jgi:hypothetical protein
MNIATYAKEHPYFLTVTCLEWKHVLLEDRFKDIVMESLYYLLEARPVCVYALRPRWCSSPTCKMNLDKKVFSIEIGVSSQQPGAGRFVQTSGGV